MKRWGGLKMIRWGVTIKKGEDNNFYVDGEPHVRELWQNEYKTMEIEGEQLQVGELIMEEEKDKIFVPYSEFQKIQDKLK